MHRTWPSWLLVTAVLVWTCALVASPRAANGGVPAGAGRQITLRQTPLGPMPTDPREISLTPDAAHVALLATAGSRHVVYIDGNEGSPYSSVQQLSSPAQGHAGPSMLMISPDQKRVAYLAGKGPSDWMMVVNNKEGPAFDRISIASFSPVGHRLAYIAQKGGKNFVVVDASVSPAYDQAPANELWFSADGQHVGYLVMSGTAPTAWHAVIDGKEGTGYVGVERLQFSREGGHHAYIARTANAQEFSVVVDAQPGPKFAQIQSITFSNDGKHVAYIALKPADAKIAAPSGKWVAVIDGNSGPVFDRIATIVVSPDGQHTAYAAWETAGARNSAYAIVDGKKSIDYVDCSTFTYSPDSQHLAYIATNNDKSVVVLDGRESDAHRSIDPASLHFTADSKRLGYVVSDEDGWRAVIDGKAGPVRRVIDAKSFAFSPDGQHYRFKTSVGSAWAVIADDAPTPAVDKPVPGEILTSADGKHTATLMIKDFATSQQTMRVMFDGKPAGPECRTIEQLQLSPDGAHVAYIGAVLEQAGAGKNAVHVILDGHQGPGFMRIDKFAFSPDGQHVAYAARGSDGKQYVTVDDFQGPAYDDVIAITADCPQTIQFRADGSLDYLVVMDRKLNRIVFSNDMIRSLPKPVEPNAPGSPGYSQLYAFGQAEHDGAKPAVLTAAPDGTLFGGTSAGGEFKKGVLFTIKPDGTAYKVIRSFEGGQGDGAYPSSIWVGPDGALYGSLDLEGPNGHGAIFRAAADGSAYTLIHPFTGGNQDGGTPVIMAMDPDGTLYGLSNRGGQRTPLHLFRMKPDGSAFKTVYNAPETPGYNDQGVGPFTDGRDGFFYGVAGQNVFKVNKDGSGYGVVRKFQGPPRDIQMADRAPILGADNILYGFASSGGTSTGGVIYKLGRDGSGYAVIVNPSDEVLSPRALAEGPDGKLYVLAGKGLVRVNKDGTDFTVLQELDGGFVPWAALVRDGAFFGMTAQGNKGGFIFRYGIGGGSGGGGAESAPTVVYQPVAPAPIDSNVEIPPTTGQ